MRLHEKKMNISYMKPMIEQINCIILEYLKLYNCVEINDYWIIPRIIGIPLNNLNHIILFFTYFSFSTRASLSLSLSLSINLSITLTHSFENRLWKMSSLFLISSFASLSLSLLQTHFGNVRSSFNNVFCIHLSLSLSFPLSLSLVLSLLQTHFRKCPLFFRISSFASLSLYIYISICLSYKHTLENVLSFSHNVFCILLSLSFSFPFFLSLSFPFSSPLSLLQTQFGKCLFLMTAFASPSLSLSYPLSLTLSLSLSYKHTLENVLFF